MFFRRHTQTTPIFFICTALPKNCLLYELYSVTEPLITTTLWVQLFIQNISQSPGYFQAERTYPMWSQSYSWRSFEFSYASYILQGSKKNTGSNSLYPSSYKSPNLSPLPFPQLGCQKNYLERP